MIGFISILYISVFVLIFLHVILNDRFIPLLQVDEKKEILSFSVLVPMKNEEKNVMHLLHQLHHLTYSKKELIYYDDMSDDETANLLQNHLRPDLHERVIRGNEKPNGWVGKCYGCLQLGNAAKNDWLVFIDADFSVKADFLYALQTTIKKNPTVAAVSGFPAYKTRPFLSKLIVPLQTFFVYSFLPSIVGNRTKKPAFTAAHGGFIAIKRRVYEEIGGHQVVWNSLIEDVELFRYLKSSGHQTLLVNPTNWLAVDMYDTNKETWKGFLKNSYAGIGFNPWIATFFSFALLFYFVIPTIGLIAAIINLHVLYCIPYLILIVQQLFISSKNQFPVRYSAFIGIAGTLYLVLFWHSIYLYERGFGYTWKGRQYK